MNDESSICNTWMGPLPEVAAGLSLRARYSDERAMKIAREVDRIHHSLRNAFKTWWDSGEVPQDLEVCGFTVERLIAQGRCESIPVAFTWLNGLVNHPEETLRRILARYDIIATDLLPYTGGAVTSHTEPLH